MLMGVCLFEDPEEVDGMRVEESSGWVGGGGMMMNVKEKGLGEDAWTFSLQCSSDIPEGRGRKSQTTPQF